MNKPNTNSGKFDVFLCYNTEDRPEILEISRQLKKYHIRPWLDDEQIRPGTTWLAAIEEQIDHIPSAAVFLGKSGLGPWQKNEIRTLLIQFIESGRPVIPVVLSSVGAPPDLPSTLKNFHWVDFRKSQPDPLKQLVWGITDKKPSELPSQTPPPFSGIPIENSAPLPSPENEAIEIHFPKALDEYPDKEKVIFVESLSKIMALGTVKLHNIKN